MKNVQDQLKYLEKEEAKIARKKAKLAERLAQDTALDKKLEAILKDSGMTVKELIKNLSIKYGQRMSSRSGGGHVRRRTRVTAEVRDGVKKAISDGVSMSQIARDRGISYAVVNNVKKGRYDKLG